jgi:ABC-type transport system involved in cytochrome bd biosynthesis fused ATPase/permease subunit
VIINMGKLIVFAAVLFVGVVGWRISDGLSADALGMAVGVLFGVTAGIPVALLIVAASRRDERMVSHSIVITHYSQHSFQHTTNIVPPGIVRAAQKWQGVARWDDEGQYWVIVNPDTGRIVARQRRQIAG